MFIPLHDGVELRHIPRPLATWGLVAVNVAIWGLGALGLFGDLQALDTALGVIPAVMTGRAELAPSLAILPQWGTPLTAMFLHVGFWHLIGNMTFLWVFGDNVEDAMGSARYLLFYLLCGFAAAALYVAMSPASESPLIGASGAMSGVIVAYLLLHPHIRIFGLVFNWLPVRVPALWMIGFWILFQVGAALFGGRAEVGWWAHVGGIAAGAALTPLFVRAGTSWGRAAWRTDASPSAAASEG
jgi:membrane associated rhomboid family serine protease